VRKAIVILLSALVVSGAAWAQSDVMLGPHNTNNTFGCQSCHAPHSAILGGQGLFLWGINTPTTTYTTYGQGTGTIATPTTGSLTGNLTTLVAPDTRVHTILCLSCHDGTFNTAMNQAVGSTGGPAAGGYSTSSTINVGASSAMGAGHSEMTTVTGNVVDPTVGLANNHPVNVLYPNGSALASGVYLPQEIIKFWKVIPAAGSPASVSFNDASGTTYSYGHAVRLFSSDGTNAYVECGSCHNPHAWQQGIVVSNGAPTSVVTAHFLRGQYVTAQDIAGFCMSCHAYMSQAWNGTGSQ